jgi:hypothetical protein
MSLRFSPILYPNETSRIQRDHTALAHESNGLHSTRILQAFRRNALSPHLESRRKPSK